MTFKDTANPQEITIEDVVRWSEELTKTIRENPTDPGLWLQQVFSLYGKIRAISKLYVHEGTA